MLEVLHVWIERGSRLRGFVEVHHGFLSTATHSILVFGRATCREECQIACEGHPLVLDPPIRVYRRDVCRLSGRRDE